MTPLPVPCAAARAQQDDGWTGKVCSCCRARLDVWTPVPAPREQSGKEKGEE